MSRAMNWDRVRTEQRAEHDPLQSGRSYIDQRKPLTDRQRKLIRDLRAELGLVEVAVPTTNREGRALIGSLLARKRAV